MQRRVVASELPLARCRWSYQLGWAAFAVFVVSVLLSAIATRTSAAERQQQASKDAAAVLQARVSPPPQTQTVYYVVVGGGGPQGQAKGARHLTRAHSQRHPHASLQAAR